MLRQQHRWQQLTRRCGTAESSADGAIAHTLTRVRFQILRDPAACVSKAMRGEADHFLLNQVSGAAGD